MEEKYTSKIIKRIKNRRIALGLSYQDLANKTGINKSTLQRYETAEEAIKLLLKQPILMTYVGYDIKKNDR